MPRKPTPDEIGDLLDEDLNGQPSLSPMAISPVVDAGPLAPYDQPPQPEPQPVRQVLTEMRQCSATSCAHNDSGRCCLDAISINDTGGCNEYEATATDDGAGRYAEEPTGDVTGGTATTGTVVPHQQSSDMRRAEPWDSRGGG